MPAEISRVACRLRCVVAATLIVAGVIVALPGRAAAALPAPGGFLAHAFGSPPTGEPYTNSREAFQESYGKGFRNFEVDMVRLKDGKILLAHDRFESRFGLPAGTRFRDVTSTQMKGRKLDGRWPVMFGTDFLHLVKNHPDARFVLDTKGDDVAIASWFVKYMAPSSLRRLVPHVYSQAHLNGLKALHRWSGYVIATYRWSATSREQKTLELVTRNHLTTIMIRPHEVSPTFESRLRAAGARWFWVHSLSEPLDISVWRLKGWGVYSNGWIGTPFVPPTPEPSAEPTPIGEPTDGALVNEGT